MVAGPARTLLSAVLFVVHRSVFVSARRALDISTDPTEDKALPPLPPPPTSLHSDCRNSCYDAKDSYCDDGGYGSEYDRCELGSDCDDCGPRRYLPPPPLPPLPPPLPPLPTYFVTNIKDFRKRWREVVQAASDAVIEIAPGSYLPLLSQLVCAKDIHLTVFSSGLGATLDGMNVSRIFKVKGCSLTLRGLSLVNGYAPAGLNQGCRNPRTGVWEPYSPFGELTGELTANAQFKPECVDSVRCALPTPTHPDHAHCDSPDPPSLRTGVPSSSRAGELFLSSHQASQIARASRHRIQGTGGCARRLSHQSMLVPHREEASP